VEVQAKLDKRVYRPNETARLEVKIRSTGTTQTPDVFVRIRYGQTTVVRTIRLQADWKTWQFALPLDDLKHSNMGIQVYSSQHRSLFIDSLLIHQATKGAWIVTDKDTYQPGDTVHYTIHAEAKTNVAIDAIDGVRPGIHQRSVSIDANAKEKASFVLPKDLAGGTHTIEYTVGKSLYRYQFNVNGPMVSAKSLTLEQPRYQPGETMKTELLVQTHASYDPGKSGLPVEIEYTIREESGTEYKTGITKETTLYKGSTLVLADIPVPTLRLGGLILVAKVYQKGKRELPLSQAMTRFETGDFQIRRVVPGKPSFALGLEDGTVELGLYATQKVSGLVRVTLEGAEVYAKEHTVEQFTSIVVTIPKARLSRVGAYAIKAMFTVANESSQGVAELRVDDSGPPTIEVDGVADKQHYASDVTPVIRATGLHLLPSGVQVTLNKEAFASGSLVTSESTHTLFVKATDSRQKSSEKTIVFTIDKTPPSVTISGVKQGGQYKSSVSATFDVTDKHLASSQATLDGKSYKKGDSITKQGWHTLVVTGTDKAGNQTKRSVSFVIGSDLSGMLQVEQPKDGQVYQQPIASAKGKLLAPQATLKVDGIPVNTGETGDFQSSFHLQKCTHTVHVKATLGNHQESRSVTTHLIGKHTVASDIKLLHTFESQPASLVVSKDAIWLSFPQKGIVQKASYNAKTGEVGVFQTALSTLPKPAAMALVPGGSLLIVDQESDQLYQLSGDGTLTKRYESAGKIADVTVSPDGTIYVVTVGGVVLCRKQDAWKQCGQLPDGSQPQRAVWDVSRSTLLVSDAAQQKVWSLKDGAHTSLIDVGVPVLAIATDGKGVHWVSAQQKTTAVYRVANGQSTIYHAFSVSAQAMQVLSDGTMLIVAGNQLISSRPLDVDCKDPRHPEEPKPVGCGCQSHSSRSSVSVWLLLVLVLLFVHRQKNMRSGRM
jgi:Zn finger protein HypA/HybF involved in hydrogenase expression